MHPPMLIHDRGRVAGWPHARCTYRMHVVSDDLVNIRVHPGVLLDEIGKLRNVSTTLIHPGS